MFHYILFVIKGLKWLKFKEFQKYGNTNSCITCDQFLFFFLKKSFFQMKEGKYVFHYLCKACINVVKILIISKAPCICYFKFVSQTKTSVNFVNMSTFFCVFPCTPFCFFHYNASIPLFSCYKVFLINCGIFVSHTCI